MSNTTNLSGVRNNVLPVDFNSSNFDGYGDTSTILRLIFVFLSRIGYLLIQLGSIPIENVYRIIFFNIFECGIAIILYIECGNMITFGSKTVEGFIGYSTDYFSNIDRNIFGLGAVLLGSAQVSCFLVARVHLISAVLISCLYCAFYQPLLAHWIWSDQGWMKKFQIMKTKVSVKDYGGNLVIHLPSSLIGAIGALFLGRRLMRLRDLDERSFAREQSATTFVGYAFIIFGYIAFTLPTTSYESRKVPDNYKATILINNTIAFGTGIVLVSLLNLIIRRKIFNYWSVINCLQGGIAGIISLAAGVDIYNYLQCVGISAVCSFIFFIFSMIISSTFLEDNCSIIASHFVCSILGAIAPAVLSDKENFNSKNKLVHILWQLICVGVVFGCTIVFSVLVFTLLTICRILRNKEEVANHHRAVSVKKKLHRRSLKRLFSADKTSDRIVPGETSREKYLEVT